MVDFQERDTRRGLPALRINRVEDAGEDADESPEDDRAAAGADGVATDPEAGAAADERASTAGTLDDAHAGSDAAGATAAGATDSEAADAGTTDGGATDAGSGIVESDTIGATAADETLDAGAAGSDAGESTGADPETGVSPGAVVGRPAGTGRTRPAVTAAPVARRNDDGEADIDEIRQQLEEPPAEDDGADDAGDESEDGAAGESADDGEGDHDHASDDDHHDHDVETLGAAVVTVSSSRTLADDPSGDRIVEGLVEAGHDVVTRELIADEYDGIQHTVDTLVRRSDVDVVVTTGGTGVTPDDRTVEAVRPLFEKELPGFGELFRKLSYEEIGTRVVATRAVAGTTEGVPVFCLPGSTDAVRLGVEEIIVREAPHLAGLAGRSGEQEAAKAQEHPDE